MRGYKKHRGLRRYYKNLAISNKIEIDLPGFFVPNNYWHFHFDPWAYGNNSFKRRKPHLDKLFRYFDLLPNKAKELNTPYQLYAVLLDYDSSSDALFFYPPKKDNFRFSYKVSELKTTSNLTNESLNSYIGNLVGYEKRYGRGGGAFCLLYKKDVGQPVEVI